MALNQGALTAPKSSKFKTSKGGNGGRTSTTKKPSPAAPKGMQSPPKKLSKGASS